jgi:hypothetical protein
MEYDYYDMHSAHTTLVAHAEIMFESSQVTQDFVTKCRLLLLGLNELFTIFVVWMRHLQ